MNLLALETSTECCSAALWRDGKVYAREAEAGKLNSVVLLPMVDALLASHALQVTDLDCIAFGSGPGSFTGLRIACGVAQGIAFGANLPTVGICTLLALAELSRASHVICCLDARMNEIYHAAYEKRGDQWHTVQAPSLCKPHLAPTVPAGAWTGCGSGFAAHREALQCRYVGILARVLDELAPHAREIAALAAVEFERGTAIAAEAAVPLYLRNKVALRVDER